MPSAYNISIIFIEFTSPAMLITLKVSNILHVIQRLSNFSVCFFFSILFSPCVFFSTHHCESLSDYPLILCLNGNLVFHFWNENHFVGFKSHVWIQVLNTGNSPVIKRLCIFKRIPIEWVPTLCFFFVVVFFFFFLVGG